MTKFRRTLATGLFGLAGLLAASPDVFAQAAATPAAPAVPPIDSGNTAWLLISTALVLMMTIPGVALFYAGMVRKKNVLATMMQSFAVTCLVAVLWMIAGYSLAFMGDGTYLGTLERFFMSGLTMETRHSLAGTVPESVFMMFQMTFAIITCALIAGAVADRMKFSALLLFVTIWLFVVYAPVAHWVWAGGFLAQGKLFGIEFGAVLDFAGGTVVHINAGVAGLVLALVIGKRRGFGHDNFAPYNVGLAVIGASLLWVGWFGFNAGSAVAADGRAGMAMLVTMIGAAGAALAWMFVEWAQRGKPSVLGIVSGAVAGLVAITPASGFVFPGGALAIGLASGAVCYWACTSLKHAVGYDDSLDAFGVHAIGGYVGAILTGVFAVGALSATEASPEGTSGLLFGNPAQLITQFVGATFVAIYTAIASWIIAKIVDALVGLRVPDEAERDGLDLALHGEAVQ
ncbi:MAG: ammonium transporter [Phreatobacter sp.]|uniref:ammonium transporter n=1 Tax=Phreatobacter sp. TaxID=1966341 RepID=UPI001A5A22B2|nr:ammonium transporter [Phreatobacter sp.]MBL8570980.1 ammonium transporter [Phreatobacter sp.]